MNLKRTLEWLGLLFILLGYLLLWGMALKLGRVEYVWASLALPLLGIGGYIYIFRFHWLVWIMVGCLPLSLTYQDVGGGLGLSVPAEVLMVVIAGTTLFFQIRKSFLGNAIWRHPITLAIGFNFLWILITSITSSMFLVSMKFTLIRFLFIWVFYLYFQHLFAHPQYIKRYFWLYILPMIGVIIYAFNRHIGYGLDQMHSHEISVPFFVDHTIYGAALAFLIPFVVIVWRRRTALMGKWKYLDRYAGWILGGVAFLFLIAVFYSFSRAAWISLIAAATMAVLLRFKVPFRWLLLGGMIVLGLAWGYRETLYSELKSTRQVSSGDVLEHAGSISNIETDPSNKERINRWMCAIRMFEEKPLWGFGPGTYQFVYGRFQITSEMTRISTKEGDRGDTHSEYLKALSETGIIGLLSWVFILLAVFQTGMRVVYTAREPRIKYLTTAALLGLTTYFTHGLINNFLYTDKMSSLFWAMCAMIVALDLMNQRFTGSTTSSPVRVDR